LSNRETGIQFAKFSVIGVFNTGIHYGIFLLLFRVGGVFYLLASTIGYCAGLINSFVLNRSWTFPSTGVRKEIEFAKFVVVNIVALLINVGMLKCFVGYLNIVPEVGQLLAIGFSMTANFLGNKFWSFQSAKKRQYV